MTGSGSAEIVDLTGAGGNLESNQPKPIGAVKVTTGASNADRAEVGIADDFGLASDVLNNLVAGYSYFKVDNGPNEFAAPSLKLSVFSAGGIGDNFGQLVYEPTWNQGGAGSQASPTGDWQTVSIAANTGAVDTGTGGWWWTGGFEQASGAGGPPIRSALEWAGLFALDPDFATARIVGINIGVGTFNQNQIGYIDNVTFGTIESTDTYDFEPANAAVPEPATMVMFSMLAVGAAGAYRRRTKRAAAC